MRNFCKPLTLVRCKIIILFLIYNVLEGFFCIRAAKISIIVTFLPFPPVCGGVCRKNARLVAVFTAWLHAAQGKCRFLSAFSGQFSKEFLWGKKLVARILKSEPLIFSLLPGGVNALKISFHFSSAENAVFGLRFCTPASRFFLKIFCRALCRSGKRYYLCSR